MKVFFSLLATIVFSSVFGQMSITNNSVSLEFGAGNRGLILPWVNNISGVSGAVNGTFAYDLSNHKVKVKYTAGWKDLSVDGWYKDDL